MKVLGFDSSGGACAAAVVIDGTVAARRVAIMEYGQAERLMPMIAEVLDEAGTAAAQLDLIAVTVGPGSFTGLRIGLASAHGLALATGIPAVGVTSFDAVKVASDPAESVVIALESRREELFLERRGDGAGGGAALVSPQDWLRFVPPGRCRLGGDGAARLAAALARRDLVIEPGDGRPDPVEIARVGLAAWQAGAARAPLPLYLRAPDTTTPRLLGAIAADGAAGRSEATR